MSSVKKFLKSMSVEEIKRARKDCQDSLRKIYPTSKVQWSIDLSIAAMEDELERRVKGAQDTIELLLKYFNRPVEVESYGPVEKVKVTSYITEGNPVKVASGKVVEVPYYICSVYWKELNGWDCGLVVGQADLDELT